MGIRETARAEYDRICEEESQRPRLYPDIEPVIAYYTLADDDDDLDDDLDEGDDDDLWDDADEDEDDEELCEHGIPLDDECPDCEAEDDLDEDDETEDDEDEALEPEIDEDA